MVRNIFKKKTAFTPFLGKDGKPIGRPAPDPGPYSPLDPPLPPTLLQKERERLLEALAVLHDLQLAIHNQNIVIGHVRENIGLLENNPWFENLYAELRAREELRPGEQRPPIPTDLADKVKRAREAGVLEPSPPGPEPFRG